MKHARYSAFFFFKLEPKQFKRIYLRIQGEKIIETPHVQYSELFHHWWISYGWYITSSELNKWPEILNLQRIIPSWQGRRGEKKKKKRSPNLKLPEAVCLKGNRRPPNTHDFSISFSSENFYGVASHGHLLAVVVARPQPRFSYKS